MLLRRLWIACVSLLSLMATSAAFAVNTYATEQIETAQYFNHIKRNPESLFMFLHAMPKGGDLHIHRSGAAYAENLIQDAPNYCINPKTLVPYKSTHCPKADLLANVGKNSALYERIIDSWSMRNFVPNKTTNETHFFGIFPQILPITSTHRVDTTAEILSRAASQNEIYLEPYITVGIGDAMAVGNKITWNSNFDHMRQALLQHNIKHVVQKDEREIKREVIGTQQKLQCHTHHPDPGCNVAFRFQMLALRDTPPSEVFAQLMASFMVANEDPYVGGVNLVQAEDGYYATRDYALQMKMIGYFHQRYPKVNISLHAGELNPKEVTPDTLRFHITQAVEVAGAHRIGHGDDIAYENHPHDLLKIMAQKPVPVEINLTSNATLLGIKGKKHPLPIYLRAGVPIVLSTDDEGILRTDLTREFERAVLNYRLSYPTLKQMVRNSITYSFMPGESLWKSPRTQVPVSACAQDTLGESASKTCTTFLANNPKAQLQWKLEHQFHVFESKYREAATA